MVFIIPVKPLNESKSRLAPILSPRQRVQLSRSLLLRTLRLAGQLGEVVVISRDKRVRRLAKEAGAWALVEAETELNAAIRQAAGWVGGRGGQAVLILPVDLPLLAPEDLIAMIELGRSAPAVVLAPCRRRRGTNALLLHPPQLISFMFGPDSFEAHRQAAQALGLEPAIYQSPTVAFDLDTPEDWAELKLNQEDNLDHCHVRSSSSRK